MKLIHKGEWISCPNGHRQLQALRDINSGDTIQSADFCFENGLHPEAGTPFDPCCKVCGAKHVKAFDDNGVIKNRPYIEGRGWSKP